MSAISDQIAAITSQITAKNSLIATLIPQEAEWRAQSMVPCEQALPAKRNACISDKSWKRSKADAIKFQISSLRTEITGLEVSRQALLDSSRAADSATINLSNQGLSFSALEIQATGQAAAAQAEAAAKARAIDTAATTKSQTDKTQQTLLIIGIALVAIVVLAIVISKIKKNKKKSKK